MSAAQAQPDPRRSRPGHSGRVQVQALPLRAPVPGPGATAGRASVDPVDPVDPVVPALTGEVQVGLAALEALRGEWQAALDDMASPSAFITPEFIDCSLRHLSNPGDEAWFVVVRQGATLVGLLPLLRSTQRHAGWPLRVLTHAGTLSGDRPGIVHRLDASAVWQAAMQTLMARRRDWQVIDLRELDEGCSLLADDARSTWQAPRQLQVQREVWTYAGHLPLQGSWDDYLASRSRNARQGYRRQERRLMGDHPDLAVEVVDDAASIEAAFDRYLAIEGRGWKCRAQVGLWSDAREPGLYRELLPRLAATGRASVWLLRAGGVDMAGLVRLRQGSIHYERFASFDPAYARYSPSTYLCMEAVRRSFGSDGGESDVLGMPQPLEERLAIYPWYPGVRRTWRLRLIHLPALLRPLAWLRARLIEAGLLRTVHGPAKPPAPAGTAAEDTANP